MRIEFLGDISGGGSGGSNLTGVGSPEGAVSAGPGIGYVQTGSGGAFWVKISGDSTTGWLLIGPGAAATGPLIYTGSAAPEGIVAAAVGSIYNRISGGVWISTHNKVSGSGVNGWD